MDADGSASVAEDREEAKREIEELERAGSGQGRHGQTDGSGLDAGPASRYGREDRVAGGLDRCQERAPRGRRRAREDCF